MHCCPFSPLFCLLKLSAHLLLSYLLVLMAPAESVEVQVMENFLKMAHYLTFLQHARSMLKPFLI